MRGPLSLLLRWINPLNTMSRVNAEVNVIRSRAAQEIDRNGGRLSPPLRPPRPLPLIRTQSSRRFYYSILQEPMLGLSTDFRCPDAFLHATADKS